MILFLCKLSDKAFHENFLTVLKLQSELDFYTDNLIILNGHNSAKNVVGVVVLFLCTCSDDAVYVYQVS